jgi:hypothetical protein
MLHFLFYFLQVLNFVIFENLNLIPLRTAAGAAAAAGRRRAGEAGARAS